MSTTVAPTALEAVAWASCSRCRSVVYSKRFDRDLRVCVECGSHERLSAIERAGQLFDPGDWQVVDLGVTPTDHLDFVDTKPYALRLDEAREKTGLRNAVLCVHGAIAGHRVVAAIMDFRFLGGSLGAADGEVITLAAETALREHMPLLIVSASGGARMQEGVMSLMQMAKTNQALADLDDAGVLTISLVTDPTYGGVAASYASACDVILAEPGARMGFAGPRVIDQTIGERLPEGFQTAESLLELGFVDRIVPRPDLRRALADLFDTMRPQLHPPETVGADPVVRDYTELPERSAWSAVEQARDIQRPTTLDYVTHLLGGFAELHGDRASGDCPAIIGGVGTLEGLPVMVIGHQKGHSLRELSAHSFGMPSPAGYRKAARLMRLAGKWGIPVITLIDTPGAHPGQEAERNGQACAIAESLVLMARLPVPVIAVVTGEGGSGGALALGVANTVLSCSNSVYSVISPEGCAAILWNDRGEAPKAAAQLGLEARRLLRMGIVDGVLPEPVGGNQRDHPWAFAALRDGLVHALRELLTLDADDLRRHRHDRFRKFGSATHGVNR